ncbi:MAG: capsule assembly Wzi family protein, partial [Muribaculaceae bacterium]|nr:capsule assembly Wzi family protein [Muribaculaceae bacterium]
PQNVKYHSKGLWLRNGNPDKFPLTFVAGLEMATHFGCASWYKDVNGEIKWVEGAHGWKGFWHALVPQPGGHIAAEQLNVEGNFMGNWNFVLAWTPKDKDWSVKAYYQHYFEDHSMLYIEYPWRDGLWGVEGKLPRNPFVSRIVYEFLYMKDQTGPVYWDHTNKIPVQISGRDNYYNHMLYASWQHWGMIIGNPLILSPLYNNGSLFTRSSRIIGNHLGFEGEPTPTISYRVLASYQRSWGTYTAPFAEVANSFNLLAEVNWHPRKIAGYSGWEGRATFGLDAGDLIGSSLGIRISIIKRGKFTF